MFQEFFTNTIEGKFIKALVYNYPLPLLNTVANNDFLIKDCYYIYNNNVIKCLQSGTLIGEEASYLLCSDDVICSDMLLLNTGYQPAKYAAVQSYSFGNSYPNITEQYISKAGYYDVDTHYHLGTFLRCLRDIYDIDLMPFYNCFNYKILSDMHLQVPQASTSKCYVLNNDNSYRVMAIPIKYNKTYTIAIDCESQILLKSIIYGPLGMLKSSEATAGTYLTDNLHEPVTVKNNVTFKKPFTYKITTTDKTLYKYEKYLYLIIQVPAVNNSSIVVLEGDYTFRGRSKVINVADIQSISSGALNSALLTQLSLLQINDRKIYAYSDRLIEYLLENVICNVDDISENISRIQIDTGRMNLLGSTKGVWDKQLRTYLYNKYTTNPLSTNIDINGFVDKDIEKFITKGYSI